MRMSIIRLQLDGENGEQYQWYLCDKWIPTKLNDKFYKIDILLVVFYQTKYWAIKCRQIDKMKVDEMCTLKQISSKTLKD